MKRLILMIVFIMNISFLIAQSNPISDSIAKPIYDTTITYHLKSKNSFYFCSKLYKIPRDCNNKDQSNCCVFEKDIYSSFTTFESGSLNCYNGTSLNWTYANNDTSAKQNTESYILQIEKQMKKTIKSTIKVSICGKEVDAYKGSFTNNQDNTFYEILFYATINEQSVYLQLSSMNEIKSNDDLSQALRQLISIK